MYTLSDTALADQLIARHGEALTQYIFEEIARAERRDTNIAAARACGLAVRHGG